MSIINIPADIQSYLTTDEKVLKKSKSSNWEIFVTDKRALFKKGNFFGKEIVEASYKHISSIEFKKDNPLKLLITGIFLVIASFVQFYYILSNPIFGTPNSVFLLVSIVFLIILFLLGIVAIASSFFVMPKFKIYVIGRDPLTLEGKLEPIIKIIRQYKEKVDTT